MSHPGLNKRELIQATAAGAALALTAQRAVAQTAQPGERLLSEGWTFREAGTGDWLPATVPGTVHTDLLANNKIDDPFWRTNEHDQQWIDKKDWEYATSFDLDAATLAHSHVELVFAGLDTYADVYVNDALVLQADNMHRAWTADIRPHAKTGANSLRIVFTSPIRIGLQKLAALGYNPPATNDQSENGGLGDKKVSVFTRKAGYHYGWDWGPRFVTSGVWRPIILRAWSGARINDLHIVQDSLTPEKAELTAVFEIVTDAAGPAMLDLRGDGVAARVEAQLAAGLNTVPLTFSLARPKLWWTNGLGDAHLYSFTGSITQGAASDSRSVRTGLRTLKIVQKPDDAGTSFYVELNGAPVFMKGANYIPNDSFLPRVTSETYARVVRSAVDTHMNMIRVWGGGVYEDDRLYDLCDENGILVWQDFMFACSMYPNDPAFLDSIRAEAEDNVRRLRGHACLALWIGNNEIDSAWENDVPNGGWGWKQLYTQAQRDEMWAAYQAIFHEILPQTVAKLDPDRCYRPSSPLATWDGKTATHADLSATKQSGDIHYWDVWWGQKPFEDYRTHIGRFMSEYGFQSFPELRTVAAYAKPEDYDIFSEVMQAHQRSSIGNGTIKNYMQRDYKVPKDFAQFLYVGQVLQAEGIKMAMEAHRARRDYCMGSLFWQINDCWPVASWSSIDYYGRWKAQQFFARKSFAPILVSAWRDGDQVSVHVVSDELKDRRAEMVIEVMDFYGKTLKTVRQPLIVKANTAATPYTASVYDLLSRFMPDGVLVRARLATEKTVLAEDRLYIRPVKDLTLPDAKVTAKARALPGGDIAIALTTDALAKNLYLSFDDMDGVFSDNYFDLLPGETAVVTFKPAKAMTAAQVEGRLSLLHMAQIA
ncbi:MAG TPA: glycoside hydrolase family 2 protein [Asticcacaulis sp.]|nr:glycoside hydrolase family 2 protein [Asticcacaulis sp.]